MFIKTKELYNMYLSWIHYLQTTHPNVIQVPVDWYRDIEEGYRQNIDDQPHYTVRELQEDLDILRRVATGEFMPKVSNLMQLGILLLVISVQNPEATSEKITTFTLSEMEIFGTLFFSEMLKQKITSVNFDNDYYYALCAGAWNDFKNENPAYTINSIADTMMYLNKIHKPTVSDLEYMGNIFLIVSDQMYKDGGLF